jgi:hypothetical protein
VSTYSDTDMERALRDTLAQRSATLPAEPAPWARFSRAERSSRRRTLRVRQGAAVAVLAAAVLVQTNVVPLPRWAPSFTTNGSAAASALLDAPIRGSLADDQTWLDGFRSAVGDARAKEGGWRAGDRDRIRVLYAGDVPGHRVALLAIPRRKGFTTQDGFQWYFGPAGASPRQMRSSLGRDSLPSVVTWMAGDDRGGAAVIVAPPGATIETSAGPVFTADGRVRRGWARSSSSDGTAVLALPGSTTPPNVEARVTLAGETLYRDAVFGPWEVDANGPTDLVKAAASTATAPVDRGLLTAVLQSILRETGLSTGGLTARVRWSGTVGVSPALLVTVQPDGGGVLAYAFHGSSAMFRQDMRLLLPAAGAEARPLAWRLRADGGDARTSEVVVVAPDGATRVELVEAGRAVPVALDASGAGRVVLAPDASAVVRAYGPSGGLLGESPVPPFESSLSGVPGDSRATRVVD